jgi:hypothetical protein
MAHTKPESLLDLASEIEAVRNLSGLKEKSMGVFYFQSVPFLHFHDSEGKRWADVKVDGAWIPVVVPFQATPNERKKFLKAVRKAYEKMAAEKSR